MQRIGKRTATVMAATAILVTLAAPRAIAQSAPSRVAEVAPQRVVVVSILDRKLALIEDGHVRRVYSVAVGAEVSPSPEGAFTIVNRLERPTYYGKGKVIGPGRGNPLGTRWMGLSKKSFGIHGTNEDHSIGKAASHGCIRMHRRDLEDLFSRVRVGDRVEIRGERDEVVARIFGASGDAAQVASVNPPAGPSGE